jgi:transposase
MIDSGITAQTQLLGIGLLWSLSGTVLVDLEQRRVLDLLQDWQPETLAAWPKRNPDIEIIARDRAGAYVDGAWLGAPHAIQVACRRRTQGCRQRTKAEWIGKSISMPRLSGLKW